MNGPSPTALRGQAATGAPAAAPSDAQVIADTIAQETHDAAPSLVTRG